jgi:serine/threonine protein kinase
MVSDWDGEYLQPGTLIDDKFEVRRLLGKGAMGAVVEATHMLRRAPVALKFMGPHMLELPGVVERFLNEGVAASRINSEHVVKVLDVSKLPSGQPYLVMEYLEGEDLSQLLEREGKNGLEDVARAVHFVLQVLRGLQVAHQAGIIHRDLKPANCFVVNRDGEPDFIKIVDFGISKVQQAEGEMHLTQEGSTMGTPLYVSLEQARDAANVDARSDLYSVAVILYELLCGHTPFMPRTMPELFIQLATVTPTALDKLRDLPPGLSDLVQKGLAKDREERFQSTTDMAYALASYADERSELVLRQLAQRGSVRVSRAPSHSPPGDTQVSGSPALPGSGALPGAGALPARNLESGTLHSVSKSHVVGGRSVALESQVPAPSGRGSKLALALLFSALLAAGAWLAFAKLAPSAPSAGPDQGAEARPAAAAAAAERVEPPSASPAQVTPTSAVSAAPSPSTVSSVAPAHSAAHARSGSAPQSSPPTAVATGTALAAPEQKQAAPSASGKPLLKKIGIQD